MSQNSKTSIVDSVFHYRPGNFVASDHGNEERNDNVPRVPIFPPCFDEESVDAVKARYDIYMKCRSSVNKLVDSLSLHLHQEAFEEVSTFFKSSFGPDGSSESWAVTREAPGGQCNQALRCNETGRFPRDRFLPTCVLCAGLNLSDHGTTHGNLKQHLRSTCTPHVISVYARNCENTENSMRHLTSGLIQSLSSEAKTSPGSSKRNGDSESSLPQRSKRGSTKAKTTELDAEIQARSKAREEMKVKNKVKSRLSISPLHDVEEWYKHYYSLERTSQKGEDCSSEDPTHKRPPLIVCFEDFEFFKPGILQDLLFILSKAHRRGLPFAIVLGLASVTGTDAVHARLPRPVTNLLWMRTVRVKKSTRTMDFVMNTLFISPNSDFPLRLSGHMLGWMSDRFLEYTFSISSFIRNLQFSIMDHFFSTRLAYLAADLGDHWQKQAKSLTKKLGVKDCVHLMSLPSVKAYGGKLWIVDKTNIEITKEKIALWLIDIHVHRKMHGHCFLGVYDTLQILKRAQGGKRKMYLDSVEDLQYWEKTKRKLSSAIETLGGEEIKNVVGVWENVLNIASKMFRCGASVDLPTALQSCLVEEGDLMTKIRTHLKSFAESSLVGAAIVPVSQVGAVSNESDASGRHVNARKKRKLAFNHLSARQSTVAVRHPDLAAVVSCLCRLFELVVEKFLRPMSGYPLHELFILKANKGIQHLFAPQPRKQVLRALSQPQHYLKSLEHAASHVHRSMPDTSILYLLMCERGKNVNLFDWFQSFCSIMSNVRDKRKAEPSLEDAISDKGLQSRFIRGIADLQYIGCFLPENRKTDHVTRIVFGM